MPSSGPFFTAQPPQLRVVIAAIVACEPEHRELIRNWFEELVDGTRGVSHASTLSDSLSTTDRVNLERASGMASRPVHVEMA